MAGSSPKFEMARTSVGGTQIGQQNIFNASKTTLQIVKDWFSPITFTQKQYDTYKHEYANSKESFFDSDDFKAWRNGETPVLFCWGIAGSGKTVLTSMVHEYLRSIQPPSTKVGIACIYCDSQQHHTQTPATLLSSVWPQFYHSGDEDSPPLYMSNLYHVHNSCGTRPDLDQITSIIQSTVQDLEKAYILIDGLDECSDADQQETFIESVKAILNASNIHHIKVQVFVTSRIKHDYFDSVPFEIQASKEEIRAMVKKRIQTPRVFRPSLRPKIAENSELRETILEKIVTKAEGMFLIADLHVRSLTHVTSITALRAALDNLPETLDKYYEAAWTRILSQEQPLKELASQTISWLHLSRRQLTVEELCHALAVRDGDSDLNHESFIAIRDILETCQGLVVVEDRSQLVRLMHPTVREFFQKQQDQQSVEKIMYLAKTCLTYLCFEVFERTACNFISSENVDEHAKPGERIEKHRIMAYRLQEFPFLDYAAENWGYHARGDCEQGCLLPIVKFLSTEKRLENAHMLYPQVFHVSARRHVSHDFKDLFPLRVAISFGLEITACELFQPSLESAAKVQHIPGMSPYMLLALLEAIENGQTAIVLASLSAGINPSPAGNLPLTILDRTFLYTEEAPRTALDKSVFYGHNEIANFLLADGPDVAITRSTMEYAVFAENRNILTKYVGTPESDGRWTRAIEILHLASAKGKVNIVKFILEQGATLESQDWSDENTALGTAVQQGQSNVVEFLLNAGADISAEVTILEAEEEQIITRSLLQEAALSQRVFKNRLELVGEFALNFNSADVDDRDAVHLRRLLKLWLTTEPNPLKLLDSLDFLAAIREDSENTKIINMLLSGGADVSRRGDGGESLLHLSIISKSRVNAILQYLKYHPGAGIDVDARDISGRTALHYAAAACCPEAMDLLIEHGADVLATDEHAVTTLHFAVRSSRCVTIVLKHGCKVEKAHNFLGTPLQFAKSIRDPNMHAIGKLESASAKLVETGPPIADSERSRPDSLVFKNTSHWMSSEKEKTSILCRNTIKVYLRGSQQSGYMKELADRDAAAKKKERLWVLV